MYAYVDGYKWLIARLTEGDSDSGHRSTLIDIQLNLRNFSKYMSMAMP